MTCLLYAALGFLALAALDEALNATRPLVRDLDGRPIPARPTDAEIRALLEGSTL